MPPCHRRLVDYPFERAFQFPLQLTLYLTLNAIICIKSYLRTFPARGLPCFSRAGV